MYKARDHSIHLYWKKRIDNERFSIIDVIHSWENCNKLIKEFFFCFTVYKNKSIILRCHNAMIYCMTSWFCNKSGSRILKNVRRYHVRLFYSLSHINWQWLLCRHHPIKYSAHTWDSDSYNLHIVSKCFHVMQESNKTIFRKTTVLAWLDCQCLNLVLP